MKIKSLLALFTTALVLWPAQAWAKVEAKVTRVDIKLTQQNITEVKLNGWIHNDTELPVRNVQIRVKLINPQNQTFENILLSHNYQLNPGQTRYFSAEKLLREYDQAYVRAEAEVEFDKTSYLNFSDWMITQNWKQLQSWGVPFNPHAPHSERVRVDEASRFLNMVPYRHELYNEARRKWNLIQFNYGKRLVQSNDLHEAMLTLANVEPNSDYYERAQKWIADHRIRAIYTRALQKAAEGNLRGAYHQMMYIPARSAYFQKAQEKMLEWKIELDKMFISVIDYPPMPMSEAAQSAYLRQAHGPEGYTRSERGDGMVMTTHWYLDYSYATHDQYDHLVNSREY